MKLSFSVIQMEPCMVPDTVSRGWISTLQPWRRSRPREERSSAEERSVTAGICPVMLDSVFWFSSDTCTIQAV